MVKVTFTDMHTGVAYGGGFTLITEKGELKFDNLDSMADYLYVEHGIRPSAKDWALELIYDNSTSFSYEHRNIESFTLEFVDYTNRVLMLHDL